jgi:hypothetical protein
MIRVSLETPPHQRRPWRTLRTNVISSEDTIDIQTKCHGLIFFILSRVLLIGPEEFSLT